MGSKLGRRRKLRSAGIATLLTGAALALSGCWGTVYGPNGGHQLLVIPGNTTDTIIWNCRAERICTLNTIRNLCLGVPLPNLSYSTCYAFTWSDHNDDMAGAIAEVTSPYADCLAAHINAPSTPRYDWFGLRLGAYGCTR